MDNRTFQNKLKKLGVKQKKEECGIKDRDIENSRSKARKLQKKRKIQARGNSNII